MVLFLSTNGRPSATEHLSTKGPKVPFYERFHRARTFRGGFSADLQRLYRFDPTTGAVTLHSTPTKKVDPRFVVKPYEPKYEKGVYNVCLKTGDSGADGTKLDPTPRDFHLS